MTVLEVGYRSAMGLCWVRGEGSQEPTVDICLVWLVTILRTLIACHQGDVFIVVTCFEL